MFEKFKQLACKWHIHSFKCEVVDALDYPHCYCLWCKQEYFPFGLPPQEFLDIRDKEIEARRLAYKKAIGQEVSEEELTSIGLPPRADKVN